MKTFIIFLLSILILLATFSADFYILSGEIKTADPQLFLLIGTVIGNLTTASGIVIAYWFGTTKGSAEKDTVISDMATKGTGSGTTTTATVTPDKTTVKTEPQKPAEPLQPSQTGVS